MIAECFNQEGEEVIQGGGLASVEHSGDIQDVNSTNVPKTLQ